ncbi:glycosyltransferase [Peribacillus butanolivorans]|uniref:glycosyltransferase n=1 Tax=Peribacillus butanolivorans TaxID=421767 RepID=UPI0036A6DDFB
MKKIGLLISGMNNGGAERVVSRLTHILSDEYIVYLILYEDTFMKYDYSGTLINLNIKATPGVLGKVIILFKRIRALKKVKKQYGLNVTISFLDSPNIVNILSRTRNCKIGVSIRNFSAYENTNSLVSKLTNLFIKIIYNKSDVVIPVTKVIANSYVRDYGIHKDKLKVIYNPYDIFNIQQLANKELEPNYRGLFTKGFTFISVGRQMRQKGFWHLIKAFKMVQQKYKNSQLIIVGKDYSNGKVQKMVNELDLFENVHLVGEQENPFNFIRNSDIYVLSSLFEGFPNALVEAMACGCPVIAADCKSGPREILFENPDIDKVCVNVEKADYGLLTQPMEHEENWDINFITESEKNLSEAMLLMIEDEKLRRHYGVKALERAKFFSYERCKQAFTEIIDKNK